MRVETIKKYRQKSQPDLIKLAVKWFNKYIRLRDCDDYGAANCISCGKLMKYGQNYHAGHYIAAGYCSGLQFNPLNVNAQCLECNTYRHGNGLEYRQGLIRRIGEAKVREIEELKDRFKRIGYKHNRLNLLEVIEFYKDKAKKEAKNKMFEVK